MTYHNLEFGRSRLDFAATGCSSNAVIDLHSVRKVSKCVFRNVSRGFKARKLLCCRRDIGRCRVFCTETSSGLVNGNFSFAASILMVQFR